MDIITRAAAGLPSPSVLTRKTTPWAGITWHHTGGSATTWKAIHDWQTDGRPEASELIYIGYSYGIGVDGRVTELRGWDYRAAGDFENSRLQVVFMGNWATKLPPPAALAAAKEFARYAEARAGKRLPGIAHRDVWPAGHAHDTDCPGNALYAWVRANLINVATAGEEDDMNADQDKKLSALWNGTFFGGPSCGQPVDDANVVNGDNAIAKQYKNGLFSQLKQIRADIAKLNTGGDVTQEQLDDLAETVATRLGSLRFVADPTEG